MTSNQDVQGLPLYVDGSRIVFLKAPVRLLDTRPGASPNAIIQPGAKLNANTVYSYQVRGLGTNIPAAARGIIGNATVVLPANNGFLTLWPTGTPQPFTSSMNYQTVNSVVNVAIVTALGPDGRLSAFPSQQIDLVIDIAAYLAP